MTKLNTDNNEKHGNLTTSRPEVIEFSLQSQTQPASQLGIKAWNILFDSLVEEPGPSDRDFERRDHSIQRIQAQTEKYFFEEDVQKIVNDIQGVNKRRLGIQADNRLAKMIRHPELANAVIVEMGAIGALKPKTEIYLYIKENRKNILEELLNSANIREILEFCNPSSVFSGRYFTDIAKEAYKELIPLADSETETTKEILKILETIIPQELSSNWLEYYDKDGNLQKAVPNERLITDLITSNFLLAVSKDSFIGQEEYGKFISQMDHLLEQYSELGRANVENAMKLHTYLMKSFITLSKSEALKDRKDIRQMIVSLMCHISNKSHLTKVIEKSNLKDKPLDLLNSAGILALTELPLDSLTEWISSKNGYPTVEIDMENPQYPGEEESSLKNTIKPAIFRATVQQALSVRHLISEKELTPQELFKKIVESLRPANESLGRQGSADEIIQNRELLLSIVLLLAPDAYTSMLLLSGDYEAALKETGKKGTDLEHPYRTLGMHEVLRARKFKRFPDFERAKYNPDLNPIIGQTGSKKYRLIGLPLTIESLKDNPPKGKMVHAPFCGLPADQIKQLDADIISGIYTDNSFGRARIEYQEIIQHELVDYLRRSIDLLNKLHPKSSQSEDDIRAQIFAHDDYRFMMLLAANILGENRNELNALKEDARAQFRRIIIDEVTTIYDSSKFDPERHMALMWTLQIIHETWPIEHVKTLISDIYTEFVRTPSLTIVKSTQSMDQILAANVNPISSGRAISPILEITKNLGETNPDMVNVARSNEDNSEIRAHWIEKLTHILLTPETGILTKTAGDLSTHPQTDLVNELLRVRAIPAFDKLAEIEVLSEQEHSYMRERIGASPTEAERLDYLVSYNRISPISLISVVSKLNEYLADNPIQATSQALDINPLLQNSVKTHINQQKTLANHESPKDPNIELKELTAEIRSIQKEIQTRSTAFTKELNEELKEEMRIHLQNLTQISETLNTDEAITSIQTSDSSLMGPQTSKISGVIPTIAQSNNEATLTLLRELAEQYGLKNTNMLLNSPKYSQLASYIINLNEKLDDLIEQHNSLLAKMDKGSDNERFILRRLRNRLRFILDNTQYLQHLNIDLRALDLEGEIRALTTEIDKRSPSHKKTYQY